MIIFLLLSFAGIPPFAGFYLKYYILITMYFSAVAYSNIFILSALLSSLILLLVYLQMVISVILPTSENTIQAFSSIKV
jgi:NADH:ubiquinone oxidoreductase subunit 2 (subunit N)